MLRFILIGLLLPHLADAGTTVMIPPTRDASIYSENDNANGAGPDLFLGITLMGNERRALVAYDDLSAIPAGAVILSVELRINVNLGRGGAISTSIHELTADWGEGTTIAPGPGGRGGPPSAGGATWNHAFFPDINWQQAGGDFDPTALSTTEVRSTGGSTFPSTPALVASVQAWVDGTAPNHGWLLRVDPGAPDGSAKRFNSRNVGEPLLVVEFEPSQAVTLTDLAISGPLSVDEESSASYIAIASFSDGSMQEVTDMASWSQDSAFGEISPSGVLTTFSVGNDELVTISATYSSEGVEVSDGLDVLILDLSQQINYGLAGGWFNTATPGQGFLFDFLLESQFMFVAAFTFDTAVEAKGGAIAGSEQRWFTAQGGFAGSTAELTIFQTRDGVFDDPTVPVTTPVGTMAVAFETCTEATITYELPDLGLAGVIPLTKLLADEICTRINDGEIDLKQARGASPLPAGEAQPINYGLIGAWFDPDTAGQGFLFDFLLDSRFMFVAWFTFDSAGAGQKGGAIPGDELRWFTAQGGYDGARADLTLFATRDGVFDDPTPPTTDPVGTMGIEFSDCTNANIDYDLPGLGLSGTIAATKLLADEICGLINEGGIEVGR